jgi:hypothetical protein
MPTPLHRVIAVVIAAGLALSSRPLLAETHPSPWDCRQTSAQQLKSNERRRAQEHFARLAQANGTNAALKAMLEETIEENQGKTREQVIAIFQDRKEQFVSKLQAQA